MLFAPHIGRPLAEYLVGKGINFVELRQGFLQYLPIGALIGLVLFVELVLVFGAWVISHTVSRS